MPKVVTFSVFLPSLSSSSAVWAHPSPHQEHSNAASIFFMIAPLSALLYARARTRETRVDVHRVHPAQSRLLRQERSAQRGEFFRGVPLDEMLAAVDEVQVEPGVEPHRERRAFSGMAAVLSSVDQPKRRRHLAEPLPERLRLSLRFLLLAAARARALEERLEILSRAHAVARAQRGRRDQGLVEEVFLQEPARIFQSGFRCRTFFSLRGIGLAATGQGRQQASGGEHDDPGHALAVLEGEAHGDAPGLRMAYETRL